jgi:hypothetical protein
VHAHQCTTTTPVPGPIRCGQRSTATLGLGPGELRHVVHCICTRSSGNVLLVHPPVWEGLQSRAAAMQMQVASSPSKDVRSVNLHGRDDRAAAGCIVLVDDHVPRQHIMA